MLLRNVPLSNYPRVELSSSFDTECFKIKAVVHDTHFKDGDRSWRYGDGFLINFITETYPDNKVENSTVTVSQLWLVIDVSLWLIGTVLITFLIKTTNLKFK
jgi:hypothetical protein